MEKNTLARLVTPYYASEAVFISCSHDTTSGIRAAIWRYSLVKSTIVHSRLPGSLWVLWRTHWWVHPLPVINRSPLFLVLLQCVAGFQQQRSNPKVFKTPQYLMGCTQRFILFCSHPIPVHHQWENFKPHRNCTPEAPGAAPQTTTDRVFIARQLTGRWSSSKIPFWFAPWDPFQDQRT